MADTPQINVFTDLGDTPQDLRGAARTAAQKYKIDPDLFGRMISAESSFNPNAVSPKGAMGLGQIMPTTASVLNLQQPFDPMQNLDTSAKYFRQQLDRFGGDTRQALAAYNWGPENVTGGKIWPQSVQDYVNKISPLQGPVPSKQVNVFRDLKDAEIATPSAVSPGSGILNTIKDFLKPYGPDIIGGLTAAVTAPEVGPLSIPLGATAAAMARAGEQAGLVQAGKTTPEEGARAVRNTAILNLGAGFAPEVLKDFAPPVARWVTAKLLGVAPNEAKGMAAVADMVDRRIPAGLGFFGRMRNLKDAENSALDEIYAKYPMGKPTISTAIARIGETAAPGATRNSVGRAELWRDVVQYYAKNSTAPRAEVEAALGPRGYDVVEALRNKTPVTVEQLFGAIGDSEKSNAWGNFFSRQKGEFDFNTARTIKQNLQTKIPYGQELEGMQRARAVMAHTLVENIAKNIPNVADRAAFLEHNAELERLINIENIKGIATRSKQLIAGQLAMPIAGGAVGYSTSYYTHQDPTAAALRGLAYGALTGPALPSGLVTAANVPAVQQMFGMPFRLMDRPESTTPLSNEQRKRIEDFLSQEQFSTR